jgi:hypothetical protein
MFILYALYIRGCIQKFPDWPPGARTANGAALCHYVQSYHYFVSHCSEFCRHNPLCCFSASVCCCCLFRYRLSPETFGYTLVFSLIIIQDMVRRLTVSYTLKTSTILHVR